MLQVSFKQRGSQVAFGITLHTSISTAVPVLEETSRAETAPDTAAAYLLQTAAAYLLQIAGWAPLASAGIQLNVL